MVQTDPYDTWEETEAALKVVYRLVYQMHETKPSKGSAEEVLWEQEMREIRKWAIHLNYRRININIRKQEQWKRTQRSTQ